MKLFVSVSLSVEGKVTRQDHPTTGMLPVAIAECRLQFSVDLTPIWVIANQERPSCTTDLIFLRFFSDTGKKNRRYRFLSNLAFGCEYVECNLIPPCLWTSFVTRSHERYTKSLAASTATRFVTREGYFLLKHFYCILRFYNHFYTISSLTTAQFNI